MSYQLEKLPQNPTTTDLSNVSGLYGPGPIIGWYITMFSVMISWIFHYERAYSGSFFDADFVAVLLLPAVAAGDIAIQLSQIPRGSESTSLPEFMSQRFALQAPFPVIRTFLPCALVLSSVTLLRAKAKSTKRAFLLSLIAAPCARIIFICPSLHRDEVPIFIEIVGLILLLLASASGLGMFLLSRRLERLLIRNFSRAWSHNPFWDLLVLYNTFVIIELRFEGPAKWISVLPKTNSQVRDLDQVLAILAGVSVLAFTIWDIVAPEKETPN